MRTGTSFQLPIATNMRAAVGLPTILPCKRVAAKLPRRSVSPFLALAIALLAGWVVLPSDGRALPHEQQPHYELALDADQRICPRVLTLYNHLLEELEQGRLHSPSWYYGYDATNFAVTQAPRLAQIGFVTPKLLVIKGGTFPIKFYSVVLGANQQPRTLALQDVGQGHDPVTFIAILKNGIGPESDYGANSVPFPPEPAADVDQLISVSELARSQEGGAHLPDAYLLTKWPGFSELFSKIKSGDESAPFPGISNSGGGFPIRPFQYKGGLYMIIDSEIPVQGVKRLRASSDDAGIVVVQHVDKDQLDDMCYLVLAPSKLAMTVKSHKGLN